MFLNLTVLNWHFYKWELIVIGGKGSVITCSVLKPNFNDQKPTYFPPLLPEQYHLFACYFEKNSTGEDWE